MISFIVPVYNCEEYLVSCIESLIETGEENEIILIDDGSTDRSSIICDDYAKKYERIRTYHIPNGGPSGARNLGIRNARKEYISFVDSDDYIDSKVYEDIMRDIKENNLDVVFTQMNLFDVANKVFVGKTDPRMDNLVKGKYSQEQILKMFIDYKIMPSPCRYVIKSSIIKDNNIYFRKHIQHEDTLWFPKLIVNCKNGLYFYDKPFYNIRMRLGSRGKLNHELRRKSILLINDELLNFSENKTDLQKDFIFQNISININFLMREFSYMSKNEKMEIKKWLQSNDSYVKNFVKHDSFKRYLSPIIGYYNSCIIYAMLLNIKVKIVDTVGLVKGKICK